MAIVTTVMLAGVVLAATVLLSRYVLAYLHFRKLELAIPGPPTSFGLGSILSLRGATPDSGLQIIIKLIGHQRQLSRICILNKMMVFVNDPADIETVMRRKEFNDKATVLYSMLNEISTKGLVQMNGAEWKAHRKVLQHGFNKEALDPLVATFSEEAEAFLHRVPTGVEIELLEPLRRTAVRSALRTAIAGDIVPDIEDQLLVVPRFLEVLLTTIGRRFFNPLLWSKHIFNLTATGRLVKETKDSWVSLWKIFGGFIDQKRQTTMLKGESVDFIRRKILIDYMTENKNGGYEMTDQDIMDEIKIFTSANVETTVSGLRWMLKILSLRPDIQEKVHAEVWDVLRDDRSVTVEDMPRLKYTECFIKEAMRMFPPVPLVGRQVYGETELAGYVVPGNSIIAVNILAAHHDPRYWDEPDRFDPDRFLPENAKERHPCAWMPFSVGNRNCIGLHYAMLNLKTFLATTLRAYRVSPVDDGHKDLKSLKDNMAVDVSSRLVGGTKVIFTPRTVHAT